MFTGVPPTPTAIRLLEGNPGHRKIPKNEPQPKQKASKTPPTWLSADAKKFWNTITPEYEAMGLFYEIDVHTFACYCDAAAEYIRMTKAIAKEGEVISGVNKIGNAYILPNPKCALKHQAFTRFQKLGMEIGHSPASRSRLGRLVDDSYDELDAYLDRKKSK